MDVKSQAVAVEMSFDKATKNKYVFQAPAGRRSETVYVSKIVYATQPRKIRVTVEVIE